jgi:hypothetical protein
MRHDNESFFRIITSVADHTNAHARTHTQVTSITLALTNISRRQSPGRKDPAGPFAALCTS